MDGLKVVFGVVSALAAVALSYLGAFADPGGLGTLYLLGAAGLTAVSTVFDFVFARRVDSTNTEPSPIAVGLALSLAIIGLGMICAAALLVEFDNVVGTSDRLAVLSLALAGAATARGGAPFISLTAGRLRSLLAELKYLRQRVEHYLDPGRRSVLDTLFCELSNPVLEQHQRSLEQAYDVVDWRPAPDAQNALNPFRARSAGRTRLLILRLTHDLDACRDMFRATHTYMAEADEVLFLGPEEQAFWVSSQAFRPPWTTDELAGLASRMLELKPDPAADPRFWPIAHPNTPAIEALAKAGLKSPRPDNILIRYENTQTFGPRFRFTVLPIADLALLTGERYARSPAPGSTAELRYSQR